MPRSALLTLALASFTLPATAQVGDLSNWEQLLSAAETAFVESRHDDAATLFVQAAGAAPSPSEKARMLNNACYVAGLVGEHSRAVAHCLQSLEIRRKLGEPLPVGRSLNNLALAQESLGEMRAAEAAFSEAADWNLRGGDTEGAVLNLANLAGLYQSVQRLREAEAVLDRASSLLLSHQDEEWFEAQNAAVEVNRGVVLERLGEYGPALEGLRRLLDRDAAPVEMRSTAATNLALMYRNLGDPQRADAWLRRALAWAKAQGDLAAQAHAHLNLGRVALEGRADAAGALREFQQAVDLAEAASDRALAVEGAIHRGRALERLGRVADARSILTQSKLEAEKLGLPEAQWSALAALGDLEARQGAAPRAVEAYAAALDLVAESRRGLEGHSRVERFLADKRSIFDGAIEALYLSGSERDDVAMQALLVALGASQQQLADSLGLRAPDGASGIDLLRRAVPDDGCALQYFVARGVVYRWTLSRSELSFERIALEATLRQQLRSALEDPASSGLLEELSQALLPTDIHGGKPVQRVLVAADGFLRSLPFGLLPVAGEPLIRRAAVSYLPNLEYLLRDVRSAPGGHVVAIGRSRFDDRTDLPAVEKELESVVGSLGIGEVLLEDRASLDTLQDALQSDVAVLHVASHTTFDDSSTGSSRILLAGDTRGTTDLVPDTISQLAAPELVVLSACSTASRFGREGAGLDSLAGAFFEAGALTLVASLWDVDDEATSALMTQFYYWLAEGRAPPEALRLAQLAMLDSVSWQHPRNWAGFITLSTTSWPAPVGHSGRARWRLGIGMLAAILALLSLGAAWRSRPR